MSRARKLLSGFDDEELTDATAWDELLSEQKIPGRVLVEVVAMLHKRKNFVAAVECIQSALRNDHAESWMYDTLAIQMSLAERPQKEIDRALLSRVDFSTLRPDQVLITAAMLARFEAWDRAIELCRELVDRNPYQSELWSIIRRYADSSKAPEHILYSRTGILKFAWPEDYQGMHGEAKAKLQELIEAAEKNGSTALASQVREELADAQSRDIHIRVEWAGDADVDLQITEPGDHECSFRNRVTPNGGLLVRTDDGRRTQTGRPTANVEEYVCRVAPSGVYVATLKLITGKVTTGKVTLRVTQYENTAHEKKHSIRVPIVAEDAAVRIQLANGRASE